MSEKACIVVFSGGRGTASIGQALAKNPRIDLYFVINGYDDGLSTGSIRKYVPGLLGPSDFRKNMARFADPSVSPSLADLLEYRFSQNFSPIRGAENFQFLARGQLPPTTEKPWSYFYELKAEAFFIFSKYIEAFLKHSTQQKDAFDYADCAIGNILIAGAFLLHKGNFSNAVEEMAKVCCPRVRILNVTNGENYWLMAAKENRELLRSEAEIVSPHSEEDKIRELFLLDEKDYIEGAKYFDLNSLEKKQKFPSLNPRVKELLARADVIVYGPGTQHSSLFPSYLTEGLVEAIQANKAATKVFVSNIAKDHEIKKETVDSLIEKFSYYMSRKGKVQIPMRDLISQYFIQSKSESADASYLEFSSVDSLDQEVSLQNWESSGGKHEGGKVAEEIIALANRHMKAPIRGLDYKVSILVPCFNEVKTVAKTIKDLDRLDLSPLGLEKEIILVDSASTDGSREQIEKFVGKIKTLLLPKNLGRGYALQQALQRASGNIIAFYPSDAEYEATDLLEMLQVFVHREYKFILGNRISKIKDIKNHISEIYPNNWLGYVLSKYGGIVLSFSFFLLFNRFIIDPLTGIKVFRKTVYNRNSFRSRHFDFDIELIASSIKAGDLILEYPVGYQARSWASGKKMNLRQGLLCLIRIFKCYFSPSWGKKQ